MTWQSFLLPYGRMPRLPFVAVTAATYILFVVLVMSWAKMPASGRLLMDLPLFLIFLVKFIAAAKRLHDIRLSAVWAAPALVIMIWGMYNNYAVPLLHAPFLSIPGFFWIGTTIVGYNTVAAVVLLLALVLTDVCLFFVPGNKGQNRYGPGLHMRDDVITDVF